jgi:phosphoglycolate phosphatase
MAGYSLIIFDLDGTLVDASPDLHTAVNLTLAERGFATRSLDDIHRFIGDGARELMLRSLPDEHKGLIDEMVPRFLEHYDARVFDKTHAYPGMEVALDSLVSVAKAVSSNKPEKQTRKILAALGWTHHFRCILGGDSRPFKKPDPRMLTAICDELGVPPSRSVMVGDGLQDIVAAHAAGMPCIGVTWGFTAVEVLRSHGADELVRSPAQMVELLRREDK